MRNASRIAELQNCRIAGLQGCRIRECEDRMNRREFVRSAAAAGIAAAVTSRSASAQRSGVKPVVVAAANGNRYKNGGALTSVEKAFGLMAAGSDVLDALIAGVNIVELDPE